MDERERLERFGEPPYRLNLGAGKTFIPGFVNIDIHERAEISMDLGAQPLPFPDNSVSTVVSHHTLEHVGDYLFALGEIHRVLRHDGELLLSLPYTTLTESHMVNPYHHHNFNEHSFDFFDPAVLKGSAAEDGATTFRRVLVRFTYMGSFGALPRPLRVWARRHLLNVVRQFDVALVAIKDPGAAVEVGSERARELERLVVELKRARTPYPGMADEPPAAGGQTGAGPRARGPARLSGSLRHRRRRLLGRFAVRHD